MTKRASVAKQMVVTGLNEVEVPSILPEPNFQSGATIFFNMTFPLSEQQPEIDEEPAEDNKICKHCEYFGCLGQCTFDQSKIENRPIDVQDKGQSFERNQLGLIDRDLTEKLFSKRGHNVMPFKDEVQDEEEKRCSQTSHQQ